MCRVNMEAGGCDARDDGGSVLHGGVRGVHCAEC